MNNNVKKDAKFWLEYVSDELILQFQFSDYTITEIDARVYEGLKITMLEFKMKMTHKKKTYFYNTGIRYVEEVFANKNIKENLVMSISNIIKDLSSKI